MAFTPNSAFPDLSRLFKDYRSMGKAFAQDRRTLISVAMTLRELAQDDMCRGDQALYLMTAQALEKRAEWLAATLPDEIQETRPDPCLHSPVNLTI